MQFMCPAEVPKTAFRSAFEGWNWGVDFATEEGSAIDWLW